MTPPDRTARAPAHPMSTHLANGPAYSRRLFRMGGRHLLFPGAVDAPSSSPVEILTMDDSHFDDLTRSLAVPSRRSLLATLATAIGAVLFSEDGAENAAAKRK